MDFFKRIFSAILSFFMMIFGVSSTDTTEQTGQVKNEHLRVVAYIVGGDLAQGRQFDDSHLSQLTDIIFIGESRFNSNGEIVLTDDFDYEINHLKSAMEQTGSKAKLHVTLFGPGAEGTFDDWDEQMNNQSEQHEKAFDSGVLENNIISLLEEYKLDGVFFDYEYPITQQHTYAYGDFLISLDAALADKYTLGIAWASWCIGLQSEAIRCIDMAELMCYDVWDDNGNHAPMSITKSFVSNALKQGFKESQIDLGIPFYGRPITHEGYWYGYRTFYNQLDENGLYYDKGTGLTFSFNNCNLVYEKTEYAKNRGLGGVMVFHYSCDLPANQSESLFNAIMAAK